MRASPPYMDKLKQKAKQKGRVEGREGYLVDPRSNGLQSCFQKLGVLS